MREVIIDETSFSSAAELHSYLARELDFPSYYGANLDALNDCLTDISEQSSLTFYMAQDVLEDNDYAQAFPKFIRSALRASRENESIEVLVHATSLSALNRLADCPGMLELVDSDAIITQAIIAKL